MGVAPDDRWPNMWRIKFADGRFSDMVNLTRARDCWNAQRRQTCYAATPVDMSAKQLPAPDAKVSLPAFRFRLSKHALAARNSPVSNPSVN